MPQTDLTSIMIITSYNPTLIGLLDIFSIFHGTAQIVIQISHKLEGNVFTQKLPLQLPAGSTRGGMFSVIFWMLHWMLHSHTNTLIGKLVKLDMLKLIYIRVANSHAHSRISTLY